MRAAVSSAPFAVQNASSGDRRRPDLDSPVVAVIGATGAVGVELIQCLQRRKFPLAALRAISAEQVRAILKTAPGVKVVDDVQRNYFPMPKDASGQDEILVGRIRQDLSDPDGRSISLFSAGDQLLKGAALNAVQIAEWICRPSR